jgi:ketosteroid isomerase-like protein
MKKIILCMLSVIAVSCSDSTNTNPDFEKNLATAKKFIELHGVEDWQSQAAMIHDELDWQPPVYGASTYGKTEHIEAMKMYQNLFDNIQYEAQSWLPGVNEETLIPDGSVRTYGTWTGIHTETGIPFELTAYHVMEFQDGKIVRGGDYFDFHGLMNSFNQ